MLIRKTWSQDGAGFTYGFTASWFLQSCCFLLLTGVVLTANKVRAARLQAGANCGAARSAVDLGGSTTRS